MTSEAIPNILDHLNFTVMKMIESREFSLWWEITYVENEKTHVYSNTAYEEYHSSQPFPTQLSSLTCAIALLLALHLIVVNHRAAHTGHTFIELPSQVASKCKNSVSVEKWVIQTQCHVVSMLSPQISVLHTTTLVLNAVIAQCINNDMQ